MRSFSMKRIRSSIAVLLEAALTLLAAGCILVHPEKHPLVQTLGSAVSYVKSLQDEDKLPGIPKGERVTLETGPVKLGTKPEKIQSVSLQLTPESKPDTSFWYRVTRKGPDETWQLVQAWRADAKGKNSIQIFPE